MYALSGCGTYFERSGFAGVAAVAGGRVAVAAGCVVVTGGREAEVVVGGAAVVVTADVVAATGTIVPVVAAAVVVGSTVVAGAVVVSTAGGAAGGGTFIAFGYVPTSTILRSREARALATTAQRTAAAMSVMASSRCLRRSMFLSCDARRRARFRDRISGRQRREGWLGERVAASGERVCTARRILLAIKRCTSSAERV